MLVVVFLCISISFNSTSEFLLCKILLYFHCSLASRTCSHNGLSVKRIGYIACSKYSRNVGARCCTLSQDVSVFVSIYPWLED